MDRSLQANKYTKYNEKLSKINHTMKERSIQDMQATDSLVYVLGQKKKNAQNSEDFEKNRYLSNFYTL